MLMNILCSSFLARLVLNNNNKTQGFDICSNYINSSDFGLQYLSNFSVNYSIVLIINVKLVHFLML
jgi:hypothetical protein